MSAAQTFWLWLLFMIASSPTRAIAVASICAGGTQTQAENDRVDYTKYAHSVQWIDSLSDAEFEVLSYLILYHQTDRQYGDKDIDCIN